MYKINKLNFIWCGTPDCIEKHTVHPPCTWCGKLNAHLQEFCPNRQSCGLDGCTSNHTIHYCNKCGRSGHPTKFCNYSNIAVVMQPKMPMYCAVILKCKVIGCEEKHAKHYCKKCKKLDVAHFSRDCDFF